MDEKISRGIEKSKAQASEINAAIQAIGFKEANQTALLYLVVGELKSLNYNLWKLEKSMGGSGKKDQFNF